MCLNRRDIQPNNTVDDGEGVDCHDVAERFDVVCIGRERCFPHSAIARGWVTSVEERKRINLYFALL